MKTKIGVGVSRDRNPIKAIKEAFAIAKTNGGIHTPTTTILFATTGYDQNALVKTLRVENGKTPMFGCSGMGTITNGISYEDPYSVQVTLIESDDFKFHLYRETGAGGRSREIGEKLGKSFSAHQSEEPIALFCLTDGLSTYFEQLREGFEATLNLKKFVPLLGGLAGDSFEFKKTYQYFNDEVLTDSTVAALMTGQGEVAVSVGHGACTVGEELEITKSDEKVIYEINGKPALRFWQDYLDIKEIGSDWGKTAMLLTMGFQVPGQKSGDYILRFTPNADSKNNSVVLNNEIPRGQTKFRMMRRDVEKVAKGNQEMVEGLKAQIGKNKPHLVMVFDCGARGKLFVPEDEKNRMLAQMKDDLGIEVPWIGFHSFGEIGPVGGKNAVHNHSAVLVAIHSKAA